MSKKGSKTFEESFARLGEVVRQLEGGSLSLDMSLSLFEEGVGLLKTCHMRMDEARRKVEILTGVDEQGNPVLTEVAEDETRTLEDRAETRGR